MANSTDLNGSIAGQGAGQDAELATGQQAAGRGGSMNPRSNASRGSSRRRRGSSKSGGMATWERIMRSLGLGLLVAIFKAVYKIPVAAASSMWLMTLPVGLLLLLTSSDFLVLTHTAEVSDNLFFDAQPLPSNDLRRQDAEILKAAILSWLYIFILIMSVFNWRRILNYFRRWPHHIVIFAYLMFGVTYSIDPTKVFTNTVLIIIMTLAAILFSIANADRERYSVLYLSVLIPMSILHIASALILTMYDVNVLDLVVSELRYGGAVGNPNSFGASAVLGVWAAGGLAISKEPRFGLRLFAILSLVLFVFSAALAGSGTSYAAILLLAVVLIWMRLLALLKPRTRLIINIGGALILFFSVLSVLLFTTLGELFLLFAQSMGKDETLTGRTELWQMAREAISQKPIFGWGFDTHISVKSVREFSMRFNHYHNGYLDTIVAGGVILLALVLYNFVRFFFAFSTAFRNNAAAFPLILPLIILLVLDLSEYLLLRPNSQQWLVYITAFVMLTYPVQQSAKKGRVSKSRGPNRKRRMRWA